MSRDTSPADDATPETDPGDQHDEHDDSGLDLAKMIAQGLAGKTGPQRHRSLKGRAQARGEKFSKPSGAHPDERDPQTLDSLVEKLVDEQGWQEDLRVRGVFSRWDGIVGRDVAAHSTPVSLEGGRLLVKTDSTAWATQIKLLAADLICRLNEVLGDGTVEVIEVKGPTGPRWASGKLRVKGRGPRDTYG